MQSQTIRVSEMQPGQTGKLVEIRAQGAVRRRLFDLGLIPGTKITCRYLAPSGSPMALFVRGSVFALRRRDAQALTVEVVAG